ncbi:FAD/NAD(P)-binding protein [Catellatospora methionotrophica]|uniref:FAD/NAD(P)-binding protein n=1 Tax=Catellatospora methionotrophica TaxID=121620 RepID=UPI0033CB990D
MTVYRLAIVGAGPYGTYALERLAATRPVRAAGRSLEIHVYERTGEPGGGQVHGAGQAPTSYLNRTAGELSFAADDSVEGAYPLLPAHARPTLHEWCRAEFAATADPRFAVAADDYPRRYLHGLGLRAAFDRYVALLRGTPGTVVHLHHAEVVDVAETNEGLRLSSTGDGDQVTVDNVLFVTGHSYHDPTRAPVGRVWASMAAQAGATFRPSAYPLVEQLGADVAGPGKTIGVAGTMLTGIDVILHLTEGRGGTFTQVDDGLRYEPSGREPARVVAFSESGLFAYTRADRVAPSKHAGVFLTTEAVDRLRARHGADLNGRRQLDYARHLFPLVVMEMAALYYATMLGPEIGARVQEAGRPAWEHFLDDPGASPDEATARLLATIAGTVDTLVAPVDRFSWQSTISPITADGSGSPDAYRSALAEVMAADIAAARRGIPADPAKTAADSVWRGLRPVIVYAVNDAGLTAESHRHFLSTWLRHHNRLAYGAAPEVMEKILAVIRHGLVDVGAGPRARLAADGGRLVVTGPATGYRQAIDVLVDARVHHFDAAADAAALYPNLLRRGLVRQWRNPSRTGDDFVPGGLDLTDDFHPVRDGGADRRLTFLGPSVEGRKFFQGGAMKPHANHHAMRNVMTWLNDFWADCEKATGG